MKNVAPITAGLIAIAGASLAQADTWDSTYADTVANAPGGAVRWERGTADTAFAQWDCFYNAFGEVNYADDGVFGGTAPTFDDLSLFNKPNEGSTATAGTGAGASTLLQHNPAGVFIIAPGFSGNIYGPVFDGVVNSFTLHLEGFDNIGAAGDGEFQQLVITTKTEGNELDYAGIVAPDGAELLGRFTLMREQDPASPGSYLVEQQWRFDVTGLTGAMDFTFLGSGPHISFQKLAADTAIVPAPVSAAALIGFGALATRRRRG